MNRPVLNDFQEATVIHAGDRPDVFTGTIPDGWQQGKGAFGGVVVALLARALLASEPSPTRALRTISADLCAPALPGEVELHVTRLRRGGNVSFLDVRMSQEGALVARASTALASARAIPPSTIHRLAPSPPPPLPPWRDVPPVPVAPPFGPVFARRYEYRSTGPIPFGGGAEPVAEGWVREAVAPSVRDEPGILALLDAWWPAVFSVETGPRAAATMGYTAQIVLDPRTLDPAEPLAYRARALRGADNFFIELRELWSGGEVVAMNQQTFALLS
jgi:hypothetical protein